jgi:ABC-2 type transport system permease protein
MSTLTKYSRLFATQVRTNFVREAVYRTNFITMLLTDLVWIAVEFALFTVIYANTTTLGGWTKEQVFFFLGIFFASDAINATFFQRNFWQFSDLINKGELDILLTKPISPVFLALTRWMSLTSILNLFLGLGIAIKYGPAAGFAGGWRWALVPIWLAIGVTAAVLLRFTFAIWVFWTDRSWAITRLYFQFFGLATKPDAIFPVAIRYTIMTFLPFAFIGSVPTRALLFGLTPLETALVGLVLVTFFFLNRFLWRAGLRRYQSASS